MYPAKAIGIRADVKQVVWNEFIKRLIILHQGLPDVVYLDLPWRIASKDPTRGVAVQYDTLAMTELKQAIPIGRLFCESMIATWIVPCVRDDVQQWLEENVFKHKADTAWVKMNRNGRLQPNTGGVIFSAIEGLQIYKRGQLSEHQRKYNLGIDVMVAPRLSNSQKSKENMHPLV